MNRILLVDDEPNLLAALQRLIRSLGIGSECIFATNGEEGLQRAREHSPDVIVTDVRMPKMSGLELLRQLKADPATSQIPVIVLTGHGDSRAKQSALELGAHDFINKPAVPAEFAARVRSLFKLKEYEDQLRQRNDMLEKQVMQLQKMENIGFLAAGFSHDLRNILAAVVGHIEMAVASNGMSESARGRLKTATDAALHASELSTQLLAMSRPAGEDHLRCDLRDLVNESLNLLTVSIRPDIQVRWTPPREPMLFVGNPMQVHQVLMNLIINAVHAISGTGTISIALSREAIEETGADLPVPGEYVRLDVSDTGVGMDAATIAHIFEPFFTTRAHGRGTGLGLSVVQKIIDEHGGRIGVTSRPGSGTTFRIHFPLAKGGDVEEMTVRGENRDIA